MSGGGGKVRTGGGGGMSQMGKAGAGGGGGWLAGVPVLSCPVCSAGGKVAGRHVRAVRVVPPKVQR